MDLVKQLQVPSELRSADDVVPLLTRLARQGEVDELAAIAALVGRAVGIAADVRWAGAPWGVQQRSIAKVEAAGQRYPMTLHAINEAQPGPQWKALFQATWPGYRAWWRSSDARLRPGRDAAEAMLARHMPELLETHRALVEVAGGDDEVAAMLALWDPPKFLPGCSQAVLTDSAGPVLIRNYDYAPELFEQVVFTSRFTGRRVIGTGDCLWGLVDGMNDQGLVVSLTFGGVSGSGAGFGIPLVVRYLLEVATTVQQAVDLARRLPVSMTYNLTMLDSSGASATVLVRPDGPALTLTGASGQVATNHFGPEPQDPDHARRFRSVERRDALDVLVAAGADPVTGVAAFLEPPLRSNEYDRSFGTLYTALYRPNAGMVEYHWPGRVWRRHLDDPSAQLEVTLSG